MQQEDGLPGDTEDSSLESYLCGLTMRSRRDKEVRTCNITPLSDPVSLSTSLLVGTTEITLPGCYFSSQILLPHVCIA